MSNLVDHPKHYTEGRKFEAIDVLEDTISRAPDPVLGSLQWQAMKYLLRLWDKDDPCLDAAKSRWYLNRLIEKLDAAAHPVEDKRLIKLPLQQDTPVAVYDDDGLTD